ncbi:MAG TPA: anti-sigma factor, partial [Bacillales bacterium]|nr:anti-sigma factor [Bacillales bacterium]
MKCEHGWHEEEVVDFVLGRLSVEKEKSFERHLESCAECKEDFHEWKTMLGENEANKKKAPSPRVKHQLIKQIEPKAQPRKKWWRKPAGGAVVALCCALMIAFLGTDLFSATPKSGRLQPVNGKALVTPQSMNGHIRYVPVKARNVNGYVWVNGSTHELMLFMNGLPPVHGKDYQAWLVSPHTRADAGLLKLDEGMARLY